MMEVLSGDKGVSVSDGRVRLVVDSGKCKFDIARVGT